MLDVLLLGLYGAAFHYVTYRAEITRWLWSRYPRWLEGLLGCAACSGFWVGAGVGWLWVATDQPALGLAAGDPLTILAAALVCLVVAPVASFAQVNALIALSGGGDDAQRTDQDSRVG